MFCDDAIQQYSIILGTSIMASYCGDGWMDRSMDAVMYSSSVRLICFDVVSRES